MSSTPANNEEVTAIRAAIRDFVAERAAVKYEPFQKKIDKLAQELAQPDLEFDRAQKLRADMAEQEAKLAELQEKFAVEEWLEDAAARAEQITLVTHSPKQMNSNAKGATGILCDLDSKQPGENLVTSFSIKRGPETAAGDVLGNAAALDVNKFLCTTVDGTTLLTRLMRKDEHLLQALSEDPGRAEELFNGFAAFFQGEKPAAHTLTKQLYFPTGDGEYHLILPLHASLLIHAIYTEINTDRFGETAREAREARKKRQCHDAEIHDYPNLGIQTFGGSKPQNVSQLNSERHGRSFLLPSFPPTWESRNFTAPLNATSIFRRIIPRRREFQHWFNALADYEKLPKPDNMDTRHGRDNLLAAMVDAVLFYAMHIRALEPGWSNASECKLSKPEKIWLDPGSNENAPEREWTEKVADSFAASVNYQLRKWKKLQTDDSMHILLKDALEDKLKMFRWEKDDDK